MYFFGQPEHIYLPLPGGYSITSSVDGSSWTNPPLLLFWDTKLLTRVSSAKLGGSNSKQEPKERVNRIVNIFIFMPPVFVEDWVLLRIKYVLVEVWSLWSSSYVECANEISILLGIMHSLMLGTLEKTCFLKIKNTNSFTSLDLAYTQYPCITNKLGPFHTNYMI